MAKNRQQLLKERRKEERLKYRQHEKRADMVATFVYDRIIELVIIPLIKKEFGFGESRLQRFREKLGNSELYSGMFRESVHVELEQIRRAKVTFQAYKAICDYTVDQAREALSFMGIGDKRMQELFNAKLPKTMPQWEELFEKNGGLTHGYKDHGFRSTLLGGLPGDAPTGIR